MQRIACALLLGTATAGAAHAQQFARIGGGAVGDGGQAIQANLHGASDVVFAADGTAYVTQTDGNRIRRIATNGVITTMVGGTRGFSGDGGPASEAAIDGPVGIAIDAAGNLYFADSGNNRIRRIGTDGNIATIVGNGSDVVSGDGAAALEAGLGAPAAIALDAGGALYIAIPARHRVRKVTTDGTITTFAGSGVAGWFGDGYLNEPGKWPLRGPQGVAVDKNGRVYIADTENFGIVVVRPDGVVASTWQDSYHMGKVPRVAIGPNGTDAWFGENGRCTIWRWDTAAGGWPSEWTRLDGACSYTGDGAPRTTTWVNRFGGMAIDAGGNLTFVDADTSQVRKFVVGSGDFVTSTFAGRGTAVIEGSKAVGATLTTGAAIAVNADGDVVLAEADDAHRLLRITPAGKIYTIPLDPLILKDPRGLAVGSQGNLFLTDAAGASVHELRADGVTLPATSPHCQALGDPLNDGGSAVEACVKPGGIARDAAGNLYIADEGHHRIRKIDAAGTITTIAGNGQAGFSGDGGAADLAKVNAPKSIAVDAGGNIYFSDSGNRRIRRISNTGVISTIAGNGETGVSGDGGSATAAAVGVVRGLAVAPNGDLWFASYGRLRYIATGIVRSVPGWREFALDVAFGKGFLLVSTKEGSVYRAQLIARANDYDGDGRSDILWRNPSSGANTIWKAADHTQQQAVTGVSNAAWKIVGQGDFDGDGYDDIVWRNTQTGMNSIWRSGNSAMAIAVTGVTNLAWAIVGVGDFDGDGKADLVWRNNVTGANVLWRSGNSATQSVVTGVTNQAWKIVGVGDFDGDGLDDLAWRNVATGANTIWRSANNATQIAVASVPNLAWKVQGVGDFDGDGRDDLFWRNATAGSNQIWNGGSAGSVRAVTTVASQAWKVVAIGDYDGDDKDDLLWRNTGNGANQVWKSGNSATLQSVTGVTNLAWSIVPWEFQP